MNKETYSTEQWNKTHYSALNVGLYAVKLDQQHSNILSLTD